MKTVLRMRWCGVRDSSGKGISYCRAELVGVAGAPIA
jgi:hypothetical protein